MSIFNLVPSVLGLVTGTVGKLNDGLGWVTGKSEKNPKQSSLWASLAISAGAVYGVDKTDIASAGTLLIKIGKMLGGI